MPGSRHFGLDQLSSSAERLLGRGTGLWPARSGSEANDIVHIRLLTLNDFHGALAPVGKVEGRPAGGAAYLAAHLARERAAHPESSLLVHAGDMIGLTPPVSGLLQDEPTGAVLNRLGFAAGAVGNHEFDEGLDELVRIVDGGSHPATIWRTGSFPGLNFPCLAANVISERTGHPILPAARVLSVAGVRIGIVGVVGTDAARQLGGITSGVRFAEEVATIRPHIAELRDHRVAVIVVLAHLGAAVPSSSAGPRNRLPEFAAALDPDVDLIVAGHTHQPPVAEFGNVITIQAHPHGLSYGAVDFWIDRRMNQVVDRQAELIPTWHAGVEPDRATAALVASFERLATPMAEAVVAVSDTPYVREPDTPEARSLGSLVADAYRATTGAEIGLVHPGELRADLPAGPITRADLYRALPGGHDLLVVRLSGVAVARLLDERGRPTRAPRPTCSGATSELAPERPQGQRISAIWLADGSRLEPNSIYSVALAASAVGAVRPGETRVAGKTLAAVESHLRGPRQTAGPDPESPVRGDVLAAS